MLVSAWFDGHSTFGLRIAERDVGLWFRPEWRWVTVCLPGERRPAAIWLTASFWEGSPELRSPRIRTFLRRHGLDSWERSRPPHFDLTALGGGVFRLRWLERVPGQPKLWA